MRKTIHCTIASIATGPSRDGPLTLVLLLALHGAYVCARIRERLSVCASACLRVCTHVSLSVTLYAFHAV